MHLLSELLGIADIHLLPQRADTADLVMPRKLIGMLASGRPVLATAHVGTELGSVVLGTATLPPELGSAPVSALPEPCGVVVPPEQPLLFAEALLQLTQDPESRYQMSESARHYAETHLHVDAVLGRFVSRLGPELLLG